MAEVKEYMSHVGVEIDGSRIYPLVFYGIFRLGQDVEEMAKHGEPFIADHTMIVVQEVTRPVMELAVEVLAKQDYFSQLRPILPHMVDELQREVHWPLPDKFFY